jgi:hypothetical protein
MPVLAQGKRLLRGLLLDSMAAFCFFQRLVAEKNRMHPPSHKASSFAYSYGGQDGGQGMQNVEHSIKKVTND